MNPAGFTQSKTHFPDRISEPDCTNCAIVTSAIVRCFVMRTMPKPPLDGILKDLDPALISPILLRHSMGFLTFHVSHAITGDTSDPAPAN